jgi:uncharacterized protein
MFRVALWAGLAALLCLVVPSASLAASFDCAKAGTPTEKAICKDPAVSKLDDQVAAAFKTAQTLWPAGNWSTYIRNEQRQVAQGPQRHLQGRRRLPEAGLRASPDLPDPSQPEMDGPLRRRALPA